MKTSISIFFLFFVFAAGAQNNNAAHGSPSGIYIYTAFQPCSEKRPNANGAVKIKVERSQRGRNNWQTIGYFSTPENKTQFADAFHKNARYALAPEFTEPNNIIPAWERMNRTYRWDSMGVYLFDRVMALSLGQIYLDTTAQPSVSYEYRLSEVKKDGSTNSPLVSNAASAPSENHLKWKPKSGKVSADQTIIRIDFNIPLESKTKMFKVYRKLEPVGEYEVIENSSKFIRDEKAGNIALNVIDKNIGGNIAYSYYVVAYDAYGNFSQPSDTAFTKTYEAKDVLAPQYFITASNSQERAIQLKWKLVNEMSVSAIQIFRSTDYEGKFDLIGYATPFDTTYADNTVKPATVYYYYLQLMDRFQKNSFRSARAYGMLDDTRAPRPVRYVNAERENGKVKVSWVTADKNISGYYVYRAVGLDTANYLQVSEFIEAKDSLTVWFDETKDLSSPYGYNYIVKQENTSRVLSRASQYAYLESAISAADVPSVMQLEVKVNAGKPILFWESLQTVTGVTGYHVLRKTNGQKDFELLTKTPLSSAINFFADSTVKPGNVYEYAIQTVMVSGEKNTSANTATFSLAFGSPSAPSAPSLTIGKEGVMVSWAKGNSVPVKEYQVFRAEQGAQQAEKLVSVPVSFSSYIDSKAIKGKSYYYYLIAVGIDNVESERGAINFIAYE